MLAQVYIFIFFFSFLSGQKVTEVEGTEQTIDLYYIIGKEKWHIFLKGYDLTKLINHVIFSKKINQERRNKQRHKHI